MFYLNKVVEKVRSWTEVHNKYSKRIIQLKKINYSFLIPF